MSVFVSLFMLYAGTWISVSSLRVRASLLKSLQVITNSRVLIVKPSRGSLVVQQFALQSLDALQVTQRENGSGEILFRSKLDDSDVFSVLGLRGLKDVQRVASILEQARREAKLV